MPQSKSSRQSSGEPLGQTVLIPARLYDLPPLRELENRLAKLDPHFHEARQALRKEIQYLKGR